MKIASAAAFALLLAACSTGDEAGNDGTAAVANAAANGADNITAIMEDSDAVPQAAPADAGSPARDWIGRWTGPEGLFLDIRPSDDGAAGRYALTVQDRLDRKADYAGHAGNGGIVFTRDGQELTIRAGTGAETGFKYLAGKSDCLIVIQGKEGYCR
jgi:hypothetical protein